MASNDFQSLLSTFQAATGTEPTENKASKESDKEKSLLELTTRLWQLSKLKQSTKALSSNSKNSTAPSATPPATRLAICLCIVEDLPHEHIWRHWVQESAAKGSISADLYVHAKNPSRIRSPWTRSKLLSVSHRPEWNDIRIVQAMLSLLKETMKDKRVTHIVFGTESCLPIVNLSDIQLDPSKSYLPYFGRRQASRFDERRCWNAVESNIVSDAIYKALPGWCTLSRKHAQDILDLPEKHLAGKDLWPAFSNCWAPEECFFPTALALLGHLPQDVVPRTLTYAEWNFRAHNERDRAHPRVFDDEWNAGLLQDLRRQHGCYFIRKIKYPMSLSRWEEAVAKSSGKRHYDNRGDTQRKRQRS